MWQSIATSCLRCCCVLCSWALHDQWHEVPDIGQSMWCHTTHEMRGRLRWCRRCLRWHSLCCLLTFDRSLLIGACVCITSNSSCSSISWSVVLLLVRVKAILIVLSLATVTVTVSTVRHYPISSIRRSDRVYVIIHSIGHRV